jgi:hypothetical protein
VFFTCVCVVIWFMVVLGLANTRSAGKERQMSHIIRVNISIDGDTYRATSVLSAHIVGGKWRNNRKMGNCPSDSDVWEFIFEAEQEFGRARIHTTYSQPDGATYSKGKTND